MKQLYFLVFSVLLANHIADAAHITGGDFTVQHIEGNTFEAVLTLYRDCFSGGAELDQSVTITIFDAVTNMQVNSFVFNGFESVIAELGNSCFTPDICLQIGTYTTQFTLPNNPNGYYLSKERCCRNTLSVNLDGFDLPFVFTLDVPDPALMNNSPIFGEYPNEAYLCVNGSNMIDFGASDADGDSLVYSFTEPLSGVSSAIDPNPVFATPKPYSTIPFSAGYSVNDQVGGVMPMTINPQTGLITAQPTAIGIFTIAVKIEEYRNGVKIGEIRRELQLASAVCAIDAPSEILTPDDQLVFDVFANTEICLEIIATDPNLGDTLLLQANGLILNGTIQPQASFPSIEGFSTVTQQFCWTPLCTNVKDEPYVVTFTAFSRGCASEILITNKDIFINVILADDEPTAITGPVPEAIIDLYDPSTYCFDYVFTDPNDADSLFLTSSSEIFTYDNVDSLQFTVDQGSISIPFCWNAICADVRDEPYFVDFQIVATNCEVNDTTNFTVPISVIVPDNLPTQVVQPPMEIFWQFYDQDTYCLPVTVTDGNFFDTLHVTANSELFGLTGNPAIIDTLRGSSLLMGQMCWTPNCSDVRSEPYRLDLKATANSCKTNDTILYPVDIFLSLPPENGAAFTFPDEGETYTFFIGDDPLVIPVLGTDPDPYDSLTLSLASPALDAAGSAPVFTTQGILQTIIGDFGWTPGCLDVLDEPYPLTFTLTSKSCQKNLSVTRNVSILVTTPTRGDIEPIANVITPNGDGKNDFWTIENKNDPCLLNFSTQVFDRWGQEVFISTDPAFQWDATSGGGDQVNPGTYFQIIEFQYRDSKVTHSGNVEILE